MYLVDVLVDTNSASCSLSGSASLDCNSQSKACKASCKTLKDYIIPHTPISSCCKSHNLVVDDPLLCI